MKICFVTIKSKHYFAKIRCGYPEIATNLKASDIVCIDISRYSNMRDINGEITRQSTGVLYEQTVE